VDVVVTCPKKEWDLWLHEGDLPGDPVTGQEYYFWLGGKAHPTIEPGERVYVVAHGMLRGYAPLVRIHWQSPTRYALVRAGGAVAVTLRDEPITGFRGFRYRWWERDREVPFPNYRTAGVG
jgi:hypothetical protein